MIVEIYEYVTESRDYMIYAIKTFKTEAGVCKCEKQMQSFRRISWVKY